MAWENLSAEIAEVFAELQGQPDDAGIGWVCRQDLRTDARPGVMSAEMREQLRKYDRENPGAREARRRRWAKRHPDSERARKQRWVANNREHVRQYKRAHRARQRAARRDPGAA